MATLYRKHRPRSFREVVGQEHVVSTLQNALKRGEIAHAYLFAGPRGTGKTTIARVFAKSLNCLEPPSAGEACLKCVVCKEIDAGSFIDLVEIDAASNRRIDEARELKSSVRTKPSTGEYRVYIIDEVHMLTPEAANAILKMLEEPPAHAIFILATTEPHKILPTVISRTQRFDFTFLDAEKIINRLQEISKKEKKKLDTAIANLVVTASGGSMRDAESILGKILDITNPTQEKVRELLGIVDLGEIIEFVDFITEEKKEDALNFVSSLQTGGRDLEQFIKSALDYTRKLLYLKLSPSSAKLIEAQLGPDHLKTANEQAQKLTEHQIYSIIRQLMEALNDTKYSPVPSLPLELAIVSIFERE